MHFLLISIHDEDDNKLHEKVEIMRRHLLDRTNANRWDINQCRPWRF